MKDCSSKCCLPPWTTACLGPPCSSLELCPSPAKGKLQSGRESAGRPLGLSARQVPSQGPLADGPAALPQDEAFRNQRRGGGPLPSVECRCGWGCPLRPARRPSGGKDGPAYTVYCIFSVARLLVWCWAQQAGSVTHVGVRPPLPGWCGCGFEGIFLLPGHLRTAVLNILGSPVSAALGRPLSQTVSCFLVGGWVFRFCWGTGVTAEAGCPVPDAGKASLLEGRGHMQRVHVGPEQVQAGMLWPPCALLACITLAPSGRGAGQQMWPGLRSQKPGGQQALCAVSRAGAHRKMWGSWKPFVCGWEVRRRWLGQGCQMKGQSSS